MPQIEMQVNLLKKIEILAVGFLIKLYRRIPIFASLTQLARILLIYFSVDTHCVRRNVIKVYATAVLDKIYQREVSRQVFKL